MPRRAAYHVRWSALAQRYEIEPADGSATDLPRPGDSDWFAWLEEVSSFAFSSQAGFHCTVLKERVQRGGVYWYGYRSLHRRTSKRYLGRTRDLTLDRLEEVAALLADSVPAPTDKDEKHAGPEQARPHPSSSHMIVLSSKLYPPHLTESLIERPHLFARLEAALVNPLILLQAPAGFGKTTLVAQWIASQMRSGNSSLKMCWVSLDASDNDPLRFWRYIITAYQRQRQSLGTEALALLSKPTSSPLVLPPLETILTLLLNDLAELPQPQLLVLDDYHVIVESAIQASLAFFLDHLPPNCHVLLLSRSEPPLPLLAWRARGNLSELHMADLRFSPEEAATFLRQTMQTLSFPYPSSQLEAVFEGWPTGLRLLSLTLQGQRTAREAETFLHSLSPHGDVSSDQLLPRSVSDYLVREILQSQSEQVQRFLLQVSQLTYLSGSLCDAITRREDGADLLASMERDGLFLELLDETDPAGPWYRFHGVWAEVLRREAMRILGSEELNVLARHASLWYEQHTMMAEAIEAALMADDAPRAAALIDQSISEEQYWNPPILLRWLSQLPEKVLGLYPGLSLLFVLLLRFPQGKEEATLPEETWQRIETILRMAEEGERVQGNLSWLGSLYAIRALSVLPLFPFTQAVDYARQALRWLPAADQEYAVGQRPELQVWRGVSLLILGIKSLHEGQLGEAQPLFQEAYTCSLLDGSGHFTCEVLLLLGTSSAVRGELHQAVEYYRQAEKLARERESHEEIASALLGRARIEFEWNELATSEHLVHEALEMVDNQNQRISNQGIFQLALLRQARGENLAAGQQLTTLLTQMQVAPTPWNAWFYPEVQGWQVHLYLIAGDIQAAQRGLNMLMHAPDEIHGMQFMRGQILQARLLLAQGKSAEARQQLNTVLPIAKKQRQTCNSLQIQVLLVLAYAAAQQKEEALHWLSQALREAQGEGFLRLFLLEGEPLARLLVPIQEGGLRSYARAILRAFAPQDLLPEPLSPQEQRVLQLVVAGRSNPQIAQELIVSVNTVKHHIKQLYRKLGVNNRLEASEVARRLHLL